MNYAKYMKYDVTAGGNAIKEYTDYPTISAFAGEAMNWANAAQLINGYDDNTIRPQGTATRGQVAVILQRFCTTVAA